MNKNIKTEIGIGIIVVILIILGGLIWFGDREEKQILETTLQSIDNNSAKGQMNVDKNVVSQNSIDNAAQVVSKYYEEYIFFLTGKTKTNNKINPNFVTKKLINSHSKLVASFPDGLPGDPFLCAQDYPNDTSALVVSQINKNDSIAKFSVVINSDWEPILVTTVKEDAVWKIDGIVCSNGNEL